MKKIICVLISVFVSLLLLPCRVEAQEIGDVKTFNDDGIESRGLICLIDREANYGLAVMMNDCGESVWSTECKQIKNLTEVDASKIFMTMFADNGASDNEALRKAGDATTYPVLATLPAGWLLPTTAELYQVMAAMTVIPAETLNETGFQHFKHEKYWTVNAYDNSKAWCIDGINNGISTMNKTSVARVRGVRTFLLDETKKLTVEVLSNDIAKGRVTVQPQKENYELNEKIFITALPSDDFTLRNWNDQNEYWSREVVIAKNTKITANFIKKIVLTPSSNDYTKGFSYTIPEGPYDYKDTVTLCVQPADSTCHFIKWVDGNNRLATRQVRALADSKYTAVFVQLPVKSNHDALGAVTVEPVKDTYQYGDVVTLRCVPKVGTRFLRWSDGVVENPRTVTLTGALDFVAEFVCDVASGLHEGDKITLEDGDEGLIFDIDVERQTASMMALTALPSCRWATSDMLPPTMQQWNLSNSVLPSMWDNSGKITTALLREYGDADTFPAAFAIEEPWYIPSFPQMMKMRVVGLKANSDNVFKQRSMNTSYGLWTSTCTEKKALTLGLYWSCYEVDRKEQRDLVAVRDFEIRTAQFFVNGEAYCGVDVFKGETIRVPELIESYEIDGFSFEGWTAHELDYPFFTKNDNPSTFFINDSIVMNERISLHAVFSYLDKNGDKYYATRVNKISREIELTVDMTLSGLTYFVDEGKITVADSNVLIINGIVVENSPETVVVREEAELKMSEGSQCNASLERSIKGYAMKWGSGWNVIASGLSGAEIDEDIFCEGDRYSKLYDLYYYDEPTHYWINYRNGYPMSHLNFFANDVFADGIGYLYANASDRLLRFEGGVKAEAVDVELSATEVSPYDDKPNKLKGFNLISNPFTHNISFRNIENGDELGLASDYFVVDENGFWIATTGETPVRHSNGILVHTLSEGKVTIRQEAKDDNAEKELVRRLKITLLKGGKQDVAYVNLGRGRGLKKLSHLDERGHRLYLPCKDDRYATRYFEGMPQQVTVSVYSQEGGEFQWHFEMPKDYPHVWLVDSLLMESYDIRKQKDISSTITTVDTGNRFSLVFSERDPLPDTDPEEGEAVEELVDTAFEEVELIEIFDLLGRKVCAFEGEEITTMEFAEGLPAGVYFKRSVDINSRVIRCEKFVVANKK